MTNKRVKNEEWTVKELISKIKQGEICKPQFQRKKKWDVFPKSKGNHPNEQHFINFLFRIGNSVGAITFGGFGEKCLRCFSNIDGNNRINAITHFDEKPFEILISLLDELKELLSTLDLSIEDREKIVHIFNQLSYNQIINFKYNRYFIENGHETFYIQKLKIFRDEFETVIENIQKKLKINGTDNFDTTVKINVSLFEGYDTNELCKTFAEINKYDSKLTVTELLSSILCNANDFTIEMPFRSELAQEITEYYNKKAEGEVLICYKFDPEKDKINAHDYIVGFQNICSKKYKFLCKIDCKTDTADGVLLFFKLWEAIYGGYTADTFTNQNVNGFILEIQHACKFLNQLISKIFNEKINTKLFNKSCQEKINGLKKNQLFMLMACIIGYNKTDIPIIQQQNGVEKCLLYHFMVSDVNDSDKKNHFQTFDIINPKGGGAFVENVTKKLLCNPNTISNKLNKELFQELISTLCVETNNPHLRKIEDGKNKGKNKNEKRRTLKLFEKILMFYFYKQHMPYSILDASFSIEHIIPNSCDWDGELDKDRTGNLIPILGTMNSSRGNRHIDEYRKTDEGASFCEFIKDIIPRDDIYDQIVSYDPKSKPKPKIKNIGLYNQMCDKNEETYRQQFINLLFNP